jgi:hypothetical protein
MTKVEFDHKPLFTAVASTIAYRGTLPCERTTTHAWTTPCREVGFRWRSEWWHCLYPADRVTLHISLKSRQTVGRVFTYCHVSYVFESRLSAEVRSGATTCPMSQDLTSQLR